MIPETNSSTIQEILTRKLSQLFPNDQQRTEAAQLLAHYGTQPGENEPLRVALAILKLASSDIEEIKKLLTIARNDYRDLLAWAEYRKEMAHPPGSLSNEELSRIRKEDQDEYQNWLAK